MVNKPVQFTTGQFLRTPPQPLEWLISARPVPYDQALEFMELRVNEIIAGQARECVWLLEHPPLYTAGTSADEADLVDKERFPVYHTGRGGQFTYHGPGQRVAYVMLDLKTRHQDVRAYVAALEAWIIGTLSAFGIDGERRQDRVGVWVTRRQGGRVREDKIAALGIRLRKWVTFHGISINIEPELEHFSGIVPCGIAQHGVTSFHDLGHLVTMDEVDHVLRQQFEALFGATENHGEPAPLSAIQKVSA